MGRSFLPKNCSKKPRAGPRWKRSRTSLARKTKTETENATKGIMVLATKQRTRHLTAKAGQTPNPFRRAPCIVDSMVEQGAEGHPEETLDVVEAVVVATLDSEVRPTPGMSLSTPSSKTDNLKVDLPGLRHPTEPVMAQTIRFTDLKPHQELRQMPWDLQLREATPVGGRISFFIQNWKLVTQDKTILDIVQGRSLVLTGAPPPSPFCHSPRFSKSETLSTSLEIQKMLGKNVIRVVPPKPGQVVSHIFLRPKKDGSFRPIVNLREVNKWVEYQHFKMEGLPIAKEILQKGDFMVKLDMKDAYFCLPIAERDQHLLCFDWGRRRYAFQVVPFGLASAPRTFTKLLKPALAVLRRLGIRMTIYLDDILVMNQSAAQLIQDRDSIIWTLRLLGFLINWEKSDLNPKQTMTFMGMVVDAENMSLSLPEGKVADIRDKCSRLLEQKRVTVRDVAAIVGKMTATLLAVLPAPLHYRHLQMEKAKALLAGGLSYESVVHLTPECRKELSWWIQYLHSWNGRTLITPDTGIVITSDASNLGWGAHTGDQVTQGLWSPAERRDLHINVRELRGARFALQAFCKSTTDKHVHLLLDNSAAVAHINKMGGTKSVPLIQETQEIWNFCLERNISLTASHLAGIHNEIADQQSRVYWDASNWRLDPTIFKAVLRKLGTCTIDLFADRLNHHLQSYVSWKPDPFAWRTDAFSFHWGDLEGYAFPPFALIARCLAKVKADNARLVMIAPVWGAQPWFPQLLKLTTSAPILLPPMRNLLKGPEGEDHPLLVTESLTLAAWKVSGVDTETKEFQQELPTFYWTQEDQARNPLTRVAGKSGLAGVVNGKQIQFEPLWS